MTTEPSAAAQEAAKKMLLEEQAWDEGTKLLPFEKEDDRLMLQALIKLLYDACAPGADQVVVAALRSIPSDDGELEEHERFCFVTEAADVPSGKVRILVNTDVLEQARQTVRGRGREND